MLTDTQVEELMAKNPHLLKQSYPQIKSLKVDSPEVMSRQATINIGTIGHVAHGKSTLVKAISGVNTIVHTGEKVRNITIKLGYANAKIFKCPKCPAPGCFQSFGSAKEDKVICGKKLPEGGKCKESMELMRHLSFVDCPGHDILMATMLTGAAVMDAALLLISADMKCPQPQTKEHLSAIEIMKLNKIIIVQNKVDLIFKKPNGPDKNYKEIKTFIKGTQAKKSPIVPISAQFKYNIDYLLQLLVTYIPLPPRDLTSAPRMIVIRSFDVNKPGCDIESLQGGVAGGSILRGILRVGDEVEIRPGLVSKISSTGQLQCRPLRSRVVTLNTEKNQLLYAIPGGLIGAGLNIDPHLSKADRLVGNIIGKPGDLPDVYEELMVKNHLLRRLVGVNTERNPGNDRVTRILKGEVLLVNVGSTSTGAKVIATNSRAEEITIVLLKPVCTGLNEKVALSRKIGKNWRLIGWGEIISGKKLQI
jgi:translation initiation factor 2 subunit 3